MNQYINYNFVSDNNWKWKAEADKNKPQSSSAFEYLSVLAYTSIQIYFNYALLLAALKLVCFIKGRLRLPDSKLSLLFGQLVCQTMVFDICYNGWLQCTIQRPTQGDVSMKRIWRAGREVEDANLSMYTISGRNR